jgi:CHAT domain-containing protein
MQPLLAPLARLKAQPGQVLLSPDGALNLVPLSALVDEQGRYLGERFALSYLSSGRDLLKLQDTASPRSGITVMADPDYGQAGKIEPSGPARPALANTTAAAANPDADKRSADLDRSGMIFKPLPGTAGEARLLQQLFKLPAGQVATGPAATEARLKRVNGPRILHIATHGFFLDDLPQAANAGMSVSRRGALMGNRRDVESDDGPFAANRRPGLGENPLLRSGLALAGANQRRSEGGEDGILTAAEAAQLDLEGTQLVVLSACQTGTGDVANGEGVYGLRRALVLAGAQSQLVSLWNVNDTATEKLMGEYYRRLQKGEGRAQALRSAQEV